LTPLAAQGWISFIHTSAADAGDMFDWEEMSGSLKPSRCFGVFFAISDLRLDHWSHFWDGVSFMRECKTDDDPLRCPRT
jgi:hypothetical protein